MGRFKLRYIPGKLLRNPGPNEYPMIAIGAAIFLLCLSPFVSRLLVFPAFAICAARIVMYSPAVSLTDMMILNCFSSLFELPGGDSLFAYYVILATVWHSFRQRQWKNLVMVMLLIVVLYLVLRMEGQFNQVVLILSGFLAVQLAAANLSEGNAPNVSLAFTYGISISCVYSIFLRGAWQLRAILGQEPMAVMEQNIVRFQGLFRDPNCFSIFLILGMCTAFRLYSKGHLGKWTSWLMIVLFSACGVGTYSKSFFLYFLVVILMMFVHFMRHRIYAQALALLGCGAVAGAASLFSVVLDRFNSFSLDDITTGRTEQFKLYLEKITESIPNFLFGLGMDAEILRLGTHNLYLEIFYHLGLVGLVCFGAYFILMLHQLSSRRHRKPFQRSDWLFRYMPLVLLLGFHMTVQGMTSTTFYVLFALAMSVIMLEERKVCVARV